MVQNLDYKHSFFVVVYLLIYERKNGEGAETEPERESKAGFSGLSAQSLTPVRIP